MMTHRPFPPAYIEVVPLPRHRALVDHIYMLRDDGQLTQPGRSVFASPFRDIFFSCRAEAAADPAMWRYNDRPPRAKKHPRTRPFSGWVLGLRCAPFVSTQSDAAHTALRRRLARAVARAEEHATCDAIVHVLDQYADILAGTGARTKLASLFATSARDVGTLAAAAHVSARTLQRRFRRATTLAPKQWLAVRRFQATTQRIIHDDGSLAQVALDEGYADQAHLTADFVRLAGMPPARFRAAARAARHEDIVRFFKDRAIQARVRLLLPRPQDALKHAQSTVTHELHSQRP